VRSLKNYGISVGVSIVIFGLVAFFMLKFITGAMLGVFDDDSDDFDVAAPSTEVSGDASPDTSVSSVGADVQGTSFAMLFIGINDISDSCDEYFPDSSGIDAAIKDSGDLGLLEKYNRYKSVGSIVLMRADKERGEYTFTSVSPITMVSTDSGTQRLGDVYIMQGRDQFIQCIEALTGISIDRYIAAKASDMEKIVTETGAVSCSIPCDIYACGYDYFSTAQKNKVDEQNKLIKAAMEKTSDSDEKKELEESLVDVELVLERGTKNVSKSAAAVMMFADYSDGVSDELALSETFAKGLMSNLSKMSQSNLTELLTKIGEYLDTNVDSGFITDNYGLISEYKNFDKTTLSLPGSFESSDDPYAASFVPDYDKAIAAFLDYRKLPA
jgi:hypothetical protein